MRLSLVEVAALGGLALAFLVGVAGFVAQVLRDKLDKAAARKLGPPKGPLFLRGHAPHRMFHYGWTWRYSHAARRGDSRVDRASGGVATAVAAGAAGPGPQPGAGRSAGPRVTADIAGPIRAWRMWTSPTNPPLLGSIGIPNLQWPPGVPLQASCLRHMMTGSYEALHDTPAPGAGCTCGIWALKVPPTGGLIGEVALWGRVIEHRIGYRAEYAYPIRLVWRVPTTMPGFPRPTGELRRLQALADVYGIPLTVEETP